MKESWCSAYRLEDAFSLSGPRRIYSGVPVTGASAWSAGPGPWRPAECVQWPEVESLLVEAATSGGDAVVPAREALRRTFGFHALREGQERGIEAVLAGRDALVVMPTGSGKSLCYQVPALVLPGVTLVVSPLIALMKDQVDSL